MDLDICKEKRDPLSFKWWLNLCVVPIWTILGYFLCVSRFDKFCVVPLCFRWYEWPLELPLCSTQCGGSLWASFVLQEMSDLYVLQPMDDHCACCFHLSVLHFMVPYFMLIYLCSLSLERFPILCVFELPFLLSDPSVLHLAVDLCALCFINGHFSCFVLPSNCWSLCF